MQIVINIPDGYVGVVMRNQKIDGSAMDKLLRQAVIDGTPLPKGHGELFDKKDLYKHLNKEHNDSFVLKADAIVSKIKPIIEADKAESEVEQ